MTSAALTWVTGRPHGTHELREAVAAQYDIIAPDDVLAFAGAQEALFWLLADLLGDGGHAVVTVPNYQSIETVPLASPASVSGLTLWTGTGAACGGRSTSTEWQSFCDPTPAW